MICYMMNIFSLHLVLVHPKLLTMCHKFTKKTNTFTKRKRRQGKWNTGAPQGVERFSGKSKDVKESHPSVIFPYWIFLSRSLLLPTHFGPSPTWNRSWTQEGQEGIIVGFEVTEHGLAAYTSWSKLKGKRTGPFFFFSVNLSEYFHHFGD